LLLLLLLMLLLLLHLLLLLLKLLWIWMCGDGSVVLRGEVGRCISSTCEWVAIHLRVLLLLSGLLSMSLRL
jgi:hypothetical protein